MSEDIKNHFGKYTIMKTATYRFLKEPDWFWKIKPPTAADELSISNLLSREITKTEADGTVITSPVSTLELAMKEIALTFAETNIPHPTIDGMALIPANAEAGLVGAVLSTMPRTMILEIWEAVGEAVPGWGPAKSTRKIIFDETNHL